METISRREMLLGAGAAVLVPGLAGLGLPGLPPGRPPAPWGRLGRRLRGRLVTRSDPAYATARQLDLAQFDTVAPRAVAYCANPGDVALCLAFAQDHDLPFAVRSGGHSYGGYSTGRGLVVDVSGIGAVAVEGAAVRVGTGARAVDVLDALAPYGLVLPGGARATIAAGGFVQGGGIGYLTRTLGTASDRVVSARVVLADGRTVTASAREHPDLFWALRGGGGGNFGVVTSFTMTPAPVDVVRVASLSWDWEHAVDMLDGFAHWLVGAPRTVGAAAVAVLGDAAPGTRPFAGLVLMSTGGAARLAAEVDRLRAHCGPPSARALTSMPHRAFMRATYGCATLTAGQCRRTPAGRLPRPAYGLVRGRLFDRPVPRAAWERALAVFDLARVAGQTHKLEVLALGGAASDPARTDTAYVHRDALLCTNFLSVVNDSPVNAEAGRAARRWADAGFAAIDPYADGETYQNFIDSSLPGWRHAYYAENYPRLTAVKSAYDPHGAFRFPQGIGRGDTEADAKADADTDAKADADTGRRTA
ncbi:FAD-binding oxidoreductase [Streptomyces sp. NPDC021093]|uniref:FAD-binding oxidoreductase n=1 Tax=Streptomyces sp. NPDC021093 TaxID=3365112 RepID=UPI0037B6F60D